MKLRILKLFDDDFELFGNISFNWLSRFYSHLQLQVHYGLKFGTQLSFTLT